MIPEPFKEDRFKTRIIVFVYQKEDYEDELKAIKEVARRAAKRVGLRFGLVTDKMIIKKLKKTTSWFPS